ncbi:MAG: double-strand break repair protein AddB [Xanthobacteraceae bacterium]
MSVSQPRVFTIPASIPFLPTLTAALKDGRLVPGLRAGDDPLALADATLYLPTRRACRLARDAFLDGLGGEAAILPRIVPLGDVDEDEIAFAEDAAGPGAAAALDLPPALGNLERRLLLARLVQQWAASPQMHAQAGAPLIAGTPAAALALADDLARLMDDMTTRAVSWDRLDSLVPDNVDEYWQLTLKFLGVAREAWPAILRERGAIEPAARRDLLIEAEAARLAAKTDAPVIAAGSTGSMPATAKLLATIAGLPHGAVVLPGLDTDLDEASWQLIAGKQDPLGRDLIAPAVGHPQFAMHGLLRRIGIERDTVVPLAEPASHGREGLLSEALRPAASTEHWQERLSDPAFDAQAETALDGLTMIEAATAEEEALAIAVALRESLETPGRSAALVTPDRALARRVLAALERWKVLVEDSNGDALLDTAAGRFALLAAEAGLAGLAPVTLLALLKHPLCRLGEQVNQKNRALAALEQAVLRGPRPRPGSGGLAHALETFRQGRDRLHPSDPRANLGTAELDAALALTARLGEALAPLEQLPPGPQAFAEIAARHRQAIVALGREASGAVATLAGNAGIALANAFEELLASPAAAGLPVAAGDYAELLRTALAERVVRPDEAPGVRVRIFGPLEARLTRVDRVILGGMVEGTWPPEARSDPWLSRPMRHELGLDLPERRIGLSAHDFAEALGTHEVILSRAAKLAGAPTVASRFVQRLAAVAGRTRWQEALDRGAHTIALARALDTPEGSERIKAPAPCPPRAARPSRLSVTEIEHWLRDPYTIYAKHVLRLQPLGAVDTPPGAADRGTVIHEAIGKFTERFAQELPQNPLEELLALGRHEFAAIEDYPEARAFWWPRFVRIARWFADWEAERRPKVAALHAEIRGEISIPLNERAFRLSARADRIERLADGRYAVLDYKTGAARSDKQVRIGLAPQLTLEAAILKNGGFREVPAGVSVAELVYVGLKGGEPAGDPHTVDFEDGTADSYAERALARLAGIAARFEDESTPYRSLVHPMWKTQYGDYDHLARVKEWSLSGGVDDEGASE